MTEEELTPAERARQSIAEYRTAQLVRAERMREVRRTVPRRVLRLVERLMLGPRR